MSTKDLEKFEPANEHTVRIRGVDLPLTSEVVRALVDDVARLKKDRMSEQEFDAYWNLAPSEWKALMSDAAFLSAVNAACLRRTFDNTSAREGGKRVYESVPAMCQKIMDDPLSSNRDKLAAGELARKIATEEDRYAAAANWQNGPVLHRIEITTSPGNTHVTEVRRIGEQS